MQNLSIKFQPNSINEVLKFVRNTKPGCSYNLMRRDQREAENSLSFDQSREMSQKDASLASKQSQSEKSESGNHKVHVNCGSIREVQLQINVKMTNVSLGFLHQKYNMEMYRLDSSLLEIDYITKYDHMNFNVRFKDAFIIDLTCYPYTINPKDYAENPKNFV